MILCRHGEGKSLSHDETVKGRDLASPVAFAIAPGKAMDTEPKRTSAERYDPREIRARRRVERAVESLGQRAMEMGLDPLALRLTRPLRVESDLRPRPWIVVLSGGITSNQVSPSRSTIVFVTTSVSPSRLVTSGR